MKGLDFADLGTTTIDSEWMDVIHPKTGEPTGARILILSPDSEEYRKLMLKRQNEQLAFTRRHGNKVSAEQLHANGLSLLVSATLDWEGIVRNGEPVPCTPENVKDAYSAWPWLEEQVNEFLGDRRNFFKK